MGTHRVLVFIRYSWFCGRRTSENLSRIRVSSTTPLTGFPEASLWVLK